MKTIVKVLLIVTSIVLFFKCNTEQKNSWSQFRGPNSMGMASENTILPLELNLDKNLLWKIPLASGLSSPCIIANRIFLTGFNPSDSALITYCIDRKKGSLLWEQKVFPDTLENIHTVSSPAVATPASDGSSVYIYFGSYGILCYGLKGNLLWERRLPILDAQNGTSGSPVIYDNILILNRIEMQKPSILAIDKHNGKTIWQYYMDVAPGSPASVSVSQSTPVIWRDQVIIHRGFELLSLSLKDGSLKWTTGIATMGNSTPVIDNNTLYINCHYNMGDSKLYDKVPDFKTMISKYDANHNDMININEIPYEWAFFRRPELDLPFQYDTLYPIRLFAQGFDSNKDDMLGEEDWKMVEKVQRNYIQDHAVAALQLDGNGESDQPVFKWKEQDYVPEIPSLLSVEDKIYMVINGGIIMCLDSETGEIVFKDRLGAPGTYLASPLYANGHIIFASYSGKVTIIKAIDKLDIVAQCDLREKIGASPVAIGDNLFIRTISGLYAFR